MLGDGWDDSNRPRASRGTPPPVNTWGLIPRAVVELLRLLTVSHGADAILSGRVVIEASYLEVYNERAYDLLGDNYAAAPASSPRITWGLMVRQDGRFENAPISPLAGARGAGRYGPKSPEPWARSGHRGIALQVREGHHGCECGAPGVGSGGPDDPLVQVSLWQTEAAAHTAHTRQTATPCTCGPSLRVVGLVWRQIRSEADALALILDGTRSRATRMTEANSGSSRSHAVLTVRVTLRNVSMDTSRINASLTLVDLAGSESQLTGSRDLTVVFNRTSDDGSRPPKSFPSVSTSLAYLRASTIEAIYPKAAGAAAGRLAARRREASCINTSLSALCSVIASLAEASRKPESRGGGDEIARSALRNYRSASAAPGIVRRAEQPAPNSARGDIGGGHRSRTSHGRCHHVAFRSSLLTRLLQSSLSIERASASAVDRKWMDGRGALTTPPALLRILDACASAPSIIVITTAGPCESTAEETLSTLLFAMRARAVVPATLRLHMAPSQHSSGARTVKNTAGNSVFLSEPRARTAPAEYFNGQRSTSPMHERHRVAPNILSPPPGYADAENPVAAAFAESLARAELEVRRLRLRLAAYARRDEAKSAGAAAATPNLSGAPNVALHVPVFAAHESPKVASAAIEAPVSTPSKAGPCAALVLQRQDMLSIPPAMPPILDQEAPAPQPNLSTATSLVFESNLIPFPQSETGQHRREIIELSLSGPPNRRFKATSSSLQSFFASAAAAARLATVATMVMEPTSLENAKPAPSLLAHESHRTAFKEPVKSPSQSCDRVEKVAMTSLLAKPKYLWEAKSDAKVLWEDT